MADDSSRGPGSTLDRQDRVDFLCGQLYSGVEAELLPAFELDDAAAYSGRGHADVAYKHATAGGALGRKRPA
eukprot:1256119-Pyramimonas_sp.AAC.1